MGKGQIIALVLGIILALLVIASCAIRIALVIMYGDCTVNELPTWIIWLIL